MLKKIIPSLLCLLLLFGGCKNKPTPGEEITPQQAIEVITAKIHRNEKDHKLYYDRARLYMQIGRANDAIADMKIATQLKDNDVDYYLLLADAYFANGDVEHSYYTLDRVLELEPDNQEAVLKQGEIAVYSRDYDRALDNLSKITEKDPSNITALTMKSHVYLEKGDTAKAIVLLRKVCDLYPDKPQAFEQLGIIYSAHHDPLAVEYLNTALRLDPQNTNTMYALAMYYQDKNQMDAAEEIYKQILDIDANNATVWHNRGYIELFTYGDNEKAIEYFDRALMCDSICIEALVNRGYAYATSGNKAMAERDFRKAHDMRPTYQPAIDGLKYLGIKL